MYCTVGRLGARTVCTQDRWSEITADRPAYYILVRDNIPSEDEATGIARRSSREALAFCRHRPALVRNLLR